MSRAAVSALIKKLERDALVQRHNPDHDRRMVVLSLTGRGEAEIAQGFAAHNQREQVWSAALDTDEQETLVHLLRKLTEGRRPEDVRRRS